MNKEMYYCNKECIVIAELSDNQSVIQLNGEEGYYDDIDEYFYESSPITLVVDNKYLHEKFLSIEDKWKKEIAGANKEANTIIQNAKNEANQIIQKAKEDKMELDNNIAKIRHMTAFNDYIDYLEGKIEYVIKKHKYCGEDEYDYTIINIKEFDERCSCDKSELAACLFRRKRNKDEVKMFISEYSDYSGAEKYGAILIHDKSELDSFVYSTLDKCSKIKRYYVFSNLVEYGYSHKLMDKYEEEELENKRNQKVKKIEELTKELNALKEDL